MRQKLLLVLAVLFGLLAFALTYQQLEAEKRRIQGDSEVVLLIKLRRNMVEGEELQVGDLGKAEVRRAAVAGRISREIPWSEVSRVVGRKLDSSVEAGQLLLSTDLKPLSRKQGFTGVIQRDRRAVSIPVDPVSAVSNLIAPNDNVDVIGTFRFPDVRGDNALDTITMTILQDVKVLAVGNRWGTDSASARERGGRTNYNTVTLLLYPDEVEMIIFASQKGKLTLSLRNFDDERIDRNIERRSVNFKLLEKEIPQYNKRREQRRK